MDIFKCCYKNKDDKIYLISIWQKANQSNPNIFTYFFLVLREKIEVKEVTGKY